VQNSTFGVEQHANTTNLGFMRVKKRREMEDTGETRAHGGGGAKRFDAKSNEDALGLINREEGALY
jgi:hypothetical protein